MRSTRMLVSLETLVAGSALLGHELEDRSRISQSQDLELAECLSYGSGQNLRSFSQRDLFCIAPLDILVSQQGGRKKFHLLELNGTGIGGITNLPDDTVEAILDSLADTSQSFDRPDGVVLLAVSGKESEKSPRLNRLMHEKLLFAEAIRSGLASQFGDSRVCNLAQLAAAPSPGRSARPTVVLGYIKELLDAVTLAEDGSLWLYGRPVMGAVNDRFCSNLLQRFPGQVDLQQLQTFNRCFAAGSDKGIAYELLNEFVQDSPQHSLLGEVPFAHAYCRSQLIATVRQWLQWGRQVVIKPHGTGLGHGIEFFFSNDEPADAIVGRIDQSLAETEQFYAASGGAFPYTVCQYVDACQVAEAGHPLYGHKYELRVVVYRDGHALKAFPSIAKVARERQGEGELVRRALINNITASGDTDKVHGADYMLPLCNRQTLALLDLTPEDLHELCASAAGYVGHVLDQVEDCPQRFGLPAEETVMPLEETGMPFDMPQAA